MQKLDVHTPIQFRNILFATDFSFAANVAIPYAAAMVKWYGAKLHILHVRPPVVNPTTPPATWPPLEEAARAEADQQTRDLLTRFAGIQPEILIKEGDLWSNLASEVEQRNIDLIVIGTRGRSGIPKLLLGSSAEEIFRRAACPVLTIGPHIQLKQIRSAEFTHILFPTDFSPESTAAAPYAISLAKEHGGYLTLLHVIPEPKVADLVDSSKAIASAEGLLHNLISDDEFCCVPECVVETGIVAQKILEVAARCGADLIVLGVRQPHGVPGAATHLPIATAHKIVSEASCPVLTVRVSDHVRRMQSNCMSRR
jgi:nucleotide-binding universal stress UspA family protein